MRPGRKKGFTLIELSIVLIISGLILVSIIIGKDLIRQSQVQNVVREVQGFRTAFHAFEEQYRDLPGDMSNATSQWSTTANGDGDGKIEASEDLRAWQQLGASMSGMIRGTYTGTDAGTPDMIIKTNVPPSEISSAGYLPQYNDGTLYGNKAGNFLALGGQYNNSMLGKILSVEEARNIDLKIDDGLASYGEVMTVNGSDVLTEVCVTGTPKAYTTTNNSLLSCSMRFFLK